MIILKIFLVRQNNVIYLKYYVEDHLKKTFKIASESFICILTRFNREIIQNELFRLTSLDFFATIENLCQ